MIYFYGAHVHGIPQLNVVVVSCVKMDKDTIRPYLNQSLDDCFGLQFATGHKGYAQIKVKRLESINDFDVVYEDWKDVLPYNHRFPEEIEFTPLEYYNGSIHKNKHYKQIVMMKEMDDEKAKDIY